MSKSIYPSIPAPGNDAGSMQATLGAMRQTLNMLILNAQKPNPNFSPSSASQVFVTFDELQKLGKIGPTGQQGVQGEQGPPGPPGTGSVLEAPEDGKIYGRRNGLWVDAGSAHYVRLRAVSSTLNNAVPNGITGVLRFDTIDEDTDGYMIGSSPWSGAKVPAGLGGIYIINGWSSGSGNQGTSLGMGVLVNSTQLTGTNKTISGPGSVNYTLDNAAVAILRLSAGDVVELFNTSVSGGTNVFTAVFMSLARIGM